MMNEKTYQFAPRAPVGKPVDLSHHFNAVVRSRTPNPLKSLYKYFQVPGMSNIAGGMPHASTFPFDNFSAQIAPPDRLINSEFHGMAPQTVRSFFSRTAKPQADHIKVPKSDVDHEMNAKIDIETALQYGRGNGLPVLVDFLREFTFEHMLQGELAYDEKEADIILTCGNTDAIAKVIGAIGTHGDTMLVEEFCYTPAIQAVAPYGIKSQAVKMDQFGMVTEGKGGLRDVLENWDPKRGRRPHFMYTVPVGHNPTGATLKDSRRREIYDLCDKFDIIIIEDSPYWHLQFSDASHNLPSKNDVKYPFLAALEKSFLTIDNSGRVIRLDTFSKTIAPGSRLGWITAQKKLVDGVLVAATEFSTQQPSGFVQAMVSELLCRSWGMDGWVKWLENLRGVYEERMRLMTATLSAGRDVLTITSNSSEDFEKVDKTTVYEFNIPDGGMFVWVHILITEHPAYKEYLARGNTKNDMMEKLWDWVALTQKSLPSPGGIFAGDEKSVSRACENFRLCFAAIEITEVEDATARWVKGVHRFWLLEAEEIERIGADASTIRKSRRLAGITGGWGGFHGGKGRLDIQFDHLHIS